MTEAVFKILRHDEAAAAGLGSQARDGDDAFAGTALDRRDGFIHLSRGEQLAGTLARHFTDVHEVLLLRIDPRALDPGTLRLERSRGGDLFPHLYGPLPVRAVIGRLTLRRGTDGVFIIPDPVHAQLV